MDAGALELVDLERVLDDEPSCESNHEHPDNRVCSEAVVARINSSCGVSGFRCGAFVAHAGRMADWPCAHCGTRVAKCWNLIPI